MKLSISKLTSKCQATIPREVRKALHLEAGDSIVFDIEDQAVLVRKAQEVDLAFARSLDGTLDEWHSKADAEAYGDL